MHVAHILVDGAVDAPDTLGKILGEEKFAELRATKGAEATPSGWQPGRPTLKVGPDLVGKVWKVWTTDQAF